MANEEKIKSELESKFNFLKDKITVKRERRMFVDYLPQDKFSQVFDFAVKNMGFDFLCTITGIEEDAHLGAIYHIATKDGVVLSVKLSTPKDNPVIKTVTEYFPVADIYEREMMDLFGVKVEGLPEGFTYPLPEDWPKGEHPLRKDWQMKKEEEKV